jgi:hypothetical protein
MDELEREAYREYDLRELFDEAKQRVIDQYAADEITEAELDEKLNNLAENSQIAERLEGHIVKMKAKKYQDLQEQYENDEITEAELEQRMDELFESGDDFLDEDPDAGPGVSERATNAGSTLRSKARYYAPPTLILAPIAAVVMIPGISPMVAIALALPLLTLGLLLYGAYWAHCNL